MTTAPGRDAEPDVEKAATEIAKRLQRDWVTLRDYQGISDGDLALSVHMVIARMSFRDSVMPERFENKVGCVIFSFVPFGELRFLSDPVHVAGDAKRFRAEFSDRCCGACVFV